MDNRRRYSIRYHPEFLTRQPSYLCLHDLYQDTYKTFHISRELGNGENGWVRLMTHGNEKIAVKGFCKNGQKKVPIKASASVKKEALSELEHLQKANGNSQLCVIKHYVEPPAKGEKSEQYSYRMIMPFVEGTNLNDFATTNIKRSRDFVLLILRLTQALQQLHADGICHGDITSNNTLVEADRDDFIVKFIDFGFAYPIDGIATSGFERLSESSEYVLDIAEERYSDDIVPAHPSQDIYTLARVLNSLLDRMGEKYKNYIEIKYPVIIKFIKQALTDVIEDRPALDPFVATLEDLVDWTKKLDKNMRALVIALDGPTESDARKLLESKTSVFTYEKLSAILPELVTHHKFSSLMLLLKIKKHLSIERISDIIKKYLNDQDYLGNTLLHYATKDGTVDDVLTLLRMGPDLTLENKEGFNALDQAHINVLTILKLQYYIKKIEQEPTETNKHWFFQSVRDNHQRQSLEAAKKISTGILFKVNNVKMHEILVKHKESIMADAELSKILSDLADQKYISRSSLDIVCRESKITSMYSRKKK